MDKNDNLNIGDKLRCVKDYHCLYNKHFKTNKGDSIFIINTCSDEIQLENSNTTTWMFNFKDFKHEQGSYIWDYFETKTDRIKRLAKEFVG